MKSTRKSIVMMAIVLAVVFAGSSLVLARGYGACGGGSCAGPGYGWGPGAGGPGPGAVMSLNLSDSQRDKILKIVETHQIEGIKARGEMIKENNSLGTVLQPDKVNAEEVRKGYEKLFSLRTDRLVARAKMIAEMKEILTPEQVKLLDELTAKRSDKLESRRGYGRSFAGGGYGDCPRR